MNSGPVGSSIADIYFDDGPLLAIASWVAADQGIGGDPGVNFSEIETLASSPGGSTVSPSFVAVKAFTADSNPPVQPNDVNPGEILGVIFNLQIGGTYADVVSELTAGQLRVGIHAQAIGVSGGSESFVNLSVPEPGLGLLMGLGLAMLAAYRR